MAEPAAAPKAPDAIGTSVSNNDAWLALRPAEDVLDADLPIVDPHHHLWDHKRHRYLLDELRQDTGSGHRIVATVFVDCLAFYRADGPEALRPVGETEFANGVAAMCASGVYGELRACAGIVSHADLTLGAAARITGRRRRFCPMLRQRWRPLPRAPSPASARAPAARVVPKARQGLP